MAIQTLVLDPNAAAYTDNEIVTKINNATSQITRSGSVAAAARPISSGEITNTELAAGVAKSNLDEMTDTQRGYVKTSPISGQYKIIAVQRAADGKFQASYDDTAV